ncbi:3-hydroxyacyl-CoA dehydrogenase family protein [Streptomyces litchfieldiae]|uniref:3-hydroxyacyl-CoA dehydrogenase NAD-binding domain-containing protein n=1 Tax=Streptomyces litchfieldiae TaxID=3075543 RepID=A0ABU2MW53_9ACTN|nr:3-hydroxyacyl-CoA dehydrogenase NAD-binding domain-containing protein [Streptomyces sp. DSM 44938]MDT0345866.1 3-hydroxyacyl-CoA dehydrogenase NAD-binding domain-containing protein [Streptomyces sp. DSM 44938]
MDVSAPDPRPVPLPTVAVVGLGTMGTGIAETLARSGRGVIGIDISDTAARRAVAALDAATARSLARGRLTEERRREILGRLRVFSDLRAAADADLVIEVVPEDYARKLAVLTELDGIVKATAILATGTNALPVTRLAAGTAHPERVVGLHFFHPAPAMKLVEIVSCVLTAPNAVAAVAELARDLGKEPLFAGDRPGLVADGLLFGYLNQAAAMYESRYATREDIDAAMRLGCGLPMGPLALLDLIGIDTARTVLEALHERSGDRLHAPAPVLGQLAEAGMTGRKAGRGFYTYREPDSAAVVPDALTPGAEPVAAEPRPVAAVGVVGSGTMAAGIAQVFAGAGYPVVLTGRDQRKTLAALDRIAASLGRSVARGRLSAGDRDAALARIVPAGSLDALADVNLVVEAVVEELPVKQRLFAALDGVCQPGAVLATTTSSLPVIACARATGRPADVIGMHFFNPAPAMKLVEVVRTVLTGDAAHATVRSVCRALRKHPVDCRDRAGFIVNALLFPYLNNAVKMVQDHYATPDAVDTAMKLGGGYPMGPFELLDAVGLDVSLAIEDVLHKEFRDPSLAPAPLLRQLVAAGCLGRKTGRGFHEYPARV